MVTETIVPTASAELCVQSFGSAADPTVLLVAGAACSMDWWDDRLCERLVAAGRHVVRYDHRDTGRSTTWPAGAPAYGADALVADCVALATHLGPRAVHLVGLSMGGGLAQTVALRHPELVASVTLMSTSPVGGVTGYLPGPEPAVLATFAEMAPGPDWPGWRDPSAVVQLLVDAERPFAGPAGLDEARARTLAERVVSRSRDVAAAQNHWLVVGGEEPDGLGVLDVRDIQVPTLVIHGDADPLFPLPHGRALASAVPAASLLVLEGVGHQHPPPSTWDVVVPAIGNHTGG